MITLEFERFNFEEFTPKKNSRTIHASEGEEKEITPQSDWHGAYADS
jgi:hypothetical protein